MLKGYSIRNTETGEYFEGARGRSFWKKKSSATNAFNQAHSRKHKSGKGIFQTQNLWVHVEMEATPVRPFKESAIKYKDALQRLANI